MNRFDLRPRTVGEVLDAAIRIWLANARTLVPLVACVVIPLEAVSAIAQAATTAHGDQIATSLFDLHLHFVREPNGTVRNVGPHISQGTFGIEFGISTLIGLLSTAACVRALADAAAGASPSLRVSITAALRRLPALIGLFVIRTVGLVVGLILFIVPGVWLAGSWSVSVPALVLEGAGPWPAVARSARLVRGRWWPVVGVLIVMDVLVGLASAALQALFGAVDGYSSHPGVVAAVLAVTLGGTVAGLLVQPFNAAVRFVLYRDLRIRRGGVELAGLADQLGVDPPDAAPAPVRARRGPGDPPYWPPPPGWSAPDADDPAEP